MKMINKETFKNALLPLRTFRSGTSC
uniref:Uncharacterized protein n=1 Tax=Anguilla anguilla TaxID=7936 RepID=A0A0E9SUI4_ANGAN